MRAEVPEAERGAAEMFESPVDRLCRAVARAGAIEEREDVRGALFEGPAEAADLDQRGRNTAGDAADHGLHHRRLPAPGQGPGEADDAGRHRRGHQRRPDRPRRDPSLGPNVETARR